MNFSRVQNTVSSNTLVLLSVAVTESWDSSFVVNNKGSNKKTLYMNSTEVYMCIYATDIVYKFYSTGNTCKTVPWVHFCMFVKSSFLSSFFFVFMHVLPPSFLLDLLNPTCFRSVFEVVLCVCWNIVEVSVLAQACRWSGH